MPIENAIADNEIEGHTGMFSASTNDGYYRLGLVIANMIRDAVMMSRETCNLPPNMDGGGSSATQPVKTDPKPRSP